MFTLENNKTSETRTQKALGIAKMLALRAAIPAALVVATYGVGAVSLSVGLIASYGLTWGIDHSILKDWWHADSSSQVKNKLGLDEKWRMAQACGVSREEFEKEEIKLIKKISRGERYKKLDQLGAKLVIIFMTLGVTGIRPEMLNGASSFIDSIAPGWGDFATYGDHWAQKFVHWMLAGAGTVLADLFDTKSAQAAESVLSPINEYVAGKIDRLPIITDGISYESIAKTEKILLAYIEWSKSVRIEYAKVMDLTNDGSCRDELARIDKSIKSLEDLLKNFRSSKAELFKFAEVRAKLIAAGNSVERTDTVSRATAVRALDPKAFTADADALFRAQYKLTSIPERGYIWVDGIVRRLDEYFGIKFGHHGYHELTRRASRSMVEFYRDMVSMPDAKKFVLFITEGWKESDPDHLMYKHQSVEHKEGWGWDCVTGDSGFNKEFVYEVLRAGLKSSYYEVVFEPGNMNVSGWRDYVIERMCADHPEMSRAQVVAYVDSHLRNSRLTSGAHFHVSAEGHETNTYQKMAAGPQTPNMMVAKR